MKKLLLLLLLCGGMAFAQDKAEIKERFWGANDPAKKMLTVPEKWKKESAVIIYKSEDFDYHKFGARVTYTTAFRKRVKLQDQAAVTEYSEFSFRDKFRSERGDRARSHAENTIGVKVIKPDGTEKEVNVDAEAITADDKKKIAVSNLEIGDIIDYYVYSVEPFKSVGAYGFDAVENTISDEYPTMERRLLFTTENDFFVNFATYNGAPELKKISKEDDSEYKYELVAKDVEKFDFPRWFYPLAEVPCYKFQVYFARSGKFEDMAAAFLPKKESIIKSLVTPYDIQDYYDGKFKAYGDLGSLKKFLRNNTFATEEEKVKAVYYYTRHMFYTRYVEAFVVREANIMQFPFYLYGTNPIFFSNERDFINFYIAFLRDAKIDFDIIAATPRANGSIKDLLLEENLKLLLRVNTENPVYLQFFSPFSNVDQVDYDIENSDAYKMKVYVPKAERKVTTIKMPVSTYQDNRTESTLTLTFSPEFTDVVAEREESMYGHNKDDDQEEKMMFYDYVDEDYNKYETKRLIDMVKNKDKRAQYVKEYEALKNKIKDKRKERFKADLEDELACTVDGHSLEIVSTGRFGATSPFTVKEKFTIKENFIKKAGPNYVVEVGKMIGQQVDLKEKEMNRTNNIYMPYPRSYKESIVVNIPEGYTVSGLDKLNKKVEKATGGFISTAKVEGNKLVIDAYKYYTHYYEPVANWKDMAAFVEEAYQFTQEKVLLKKG
ncbi:hypothetical protein ACLI1A_12825 [Flavobacterium sp. RHBU_3]|uniref:hypothetical protein n=1 Tax=Flavobacterium sp. RHBU_3 TaxID=3391184 RepID=UPI0039852D84